MSEKDTAKQRLVDVTIQLICQGKKPSEITVADITEKAGVGNGMVNYHFQSKDNLMRTAVKRVMICAKKSLSEKLKIYENAPAVERLAVILKETANSFAENPEICKIAILDNLQNDASISHILSDVEVFNDCIRELYADNKRRMQIENYVIAGFLNYIFLKADVIKEETNFDFYDKQQRDMAVDNLIYDLLNRCDSKYLDNTNCN